MKLEFNATIDKVNCHIRANHCRPTRECDLDSRPHKHYSIEFHCVFAGQEVITLPLENREIPLFAGNILLLPQNVYHGVYTKDTVVERICFNFSAEPSGKEISPIMELCLGIREPVLFSDSKTAVIVEQIQSICMQSSGNVRSLRLGIHLLAVALELMSRVVNVAAVSEPADSLVLRQRWIIEDYITQHYTDNLGIAGLAKELYLSQRQTSTLVRRYFGDSYKNIIIGRRMELANIYLHNTNMGLEQIAYETGYHSYSGFATCFKQYFGMSPQQKRDQLKRTEREL